MQAIRILTVLGLVALATLDATAQQSATATLARTGPSSSSALRSSARVLPGTRADAFTTIQGNALTSTDGTLADGIVRLRDARYGRIVGTTITDKAGLFAFRSVDPGSYVVELLDANQSVLAASQILNVNAGEAVSAVVKLPFRVPPFAGVLGHSASSAAIVTTTAAASGVLATEVSGEAASPRR